MHSYLKITFCLVLLKSTAILSYGQAKSVIKKQHDIKSALFILNTNIIANGFVARLDPKDFQGIALYNNQDAPGALKDLNPGGVVVITYNGRVKSESFAELSRRLGLQGSISFVLNGHTLDAAQVATLRIVPEAIDQVRTTSTPGISGTVVNISLVEAKSNNHKTASGATMIR
ncbi:hypothetical protein [Hymenobacter metallilatus]|uniref:Uncharacterized protein n=1 Tax=Hymenobacter metallilatus TaxID=2493666 RepID=A0A3R9LUN6_9BACT|nr:hypothetical protein [Hymenobacter metallilatus]RSK23821.1 hypothetical protein EI290_22140 [Hymenobacter metallilatus]